MTWRAGALPGIVLGLVVLVLIQKFWYFAGFPAIACGCWAAARAREFPVRAAERVSAAGLAGLLGAGIMEIGGTIEGFVSFDKVLDSGVLGLFAMAGPRGVPLVLLAPLTLIILGAVLGGLLAAAVASGFFPSARG
ncbi:MAG: hypothetical protein ABI682_09570 [Acidobacteriota bacterium]